MFEFYKKRDFGELVGDTFQFLKLYGRNYFKNYFIINGLLLILLMVVIIIGYGEILSSLFGSNIDGRGSYMNVNNFLEENVEMFAFVSIFVVILFLGISVVNYSYPVLYMKRMSERGDANIKVDDIITDFKSNSKRIFFLFLGITFIVMPLALIVFLFSYVLILVLIGILLMFFILPIIMNVVNFILYDYLHTNKSFFSVFSDSLYAQFSYKNNYGNPFWKYWASTVVIYFIIQTISTIFTLIPIFLMIGGMLVIPQQGGSEEEFVSSFFIILFVVYAFAIVMSFIVSNILYINAGLMYYDNRTDLHQRKDLTEIDTIGKNEF